MNDETLFAAALELADRADREAFLVRECADRPELRAQVAELLRAHEQANSLLDDPTRTAHFDGDTKDDGGGLQIRCPHCHTPLRLAADAELESIRCSNCDSDFSLVSEAETSHRDAATVADVGHFRLIERVGMGAFGTVWKAHDTKLSRTVAIKIPRKGQFDPEKELAFLREAQNAAQLSHPGIVPVHEVGRDGDTLYIVSDFVEGLTLADWLVGQQPAIREAVTIASKVAAALHHAHERNVVHRDLKPGNIMLDDDLEPHLMDFGLACQEVSDVTVSLDGAVLGTPAYMSPEQANGEGNQAGRRSDIYSLGVVLFQLLTGELPFRGNLRRLLHQVIHDEPPSPRTLNGNVSRDLETITLKCLEKDSDRRYETADIVRQELQRVRSGEPILARPISKPERLYRWMGRHKAISALAASVVLTLALGVLVSGYYAIAATKSGKNARAAESLALEREADTIVQLGKTQIALAGAAFQAGDGRRTQQYLEQSPEHVRDTNWDYLDRYSDESLYRMPPAWTRDVIADPLGSGTFYLCNQGDVGHSELLRVVGKTGEVLEKLPLKNGFAQGAVSPDGQYLVLAPQHRTNGSYKVSIFHTHPLALSKTIVIDGLSTVKRGALFFSSDSRTFVIRTGAYESTLGTLKFNVESDEVETLSKTFQARETANKQPVAFGTVGNRLTAIDMDSGKVRWSGPKLAGNACDMGICFDDSIIVVAYSDAGALTMHHGSDGELLRTIHIPADSETLRQWDQRLVFARRAPYFAHVHSRGETKDLKIWRCDPNAKRPLRVLFCRRDKHFDWDDEAGLIVGGYFGVSGYPIGQVRSELIPLQSKGKKAVFLDDAHFAAHISEGEGVSVVDLANPGEMLLSRHGYADVTRSRTRDCCLAGNPGWENSRTPLLLVTPYSVSEYMKPQDMILDFQVSPGAQYVATAGEYRTLNVLHRTESNAWEKALSISNSGDQTSKTSLFFPDAETPTLLASNVMDPGGESYREHRMYDLQTGKLLFTKKDPLIYGAMELNPAGRVLWTGAPDGLLRGYDSQTLELLLEQRCHDQDVTAIAFRPDNQMLASGDAKGIIRLWNMKDGRLEECVDELIATSEPIESLDFNESGKRLLSLSGMQIRVWEVDSPTTAQEVSPEP